MTREFKQCPECNIDMDLVNVSHHILGKNGNEWKEYKEDVVAEFYQCPECDYQSEEHGDWN